MSVRNSFLFFLLITTLLISCSKAEDDVLSPDRSTTITVINAGPDTLNIYQKGTRLNSGSNLLPGGQYTGLQVSVGTTNYQFKRAGMPDVLMEAPFNIQLFNNGAFKNTLFVAGQSADKVFLLRDSLPAADTTYIRFINASPIEKTLEVSIGNNFKYENVAFKATTPFIPIVNGRVYMSIRQTGDTTQIAKGYLTLTKNATYTLFTKGVLKGIGTNAFGARMLLAR